MLSIVSQARCIIQNFVITYGGLLKKCHSNSTFDYQQRREWRQFLVTCIIKSLSWTCNTNALAKNEQPIPIESKASPTPCEWQIIFYPLTSHLHVRCDKRLTALSLLPLKSAWMNCISLSRQAHSSRLGPPSHLHCIKPSHILRMALVRYKFHSNSFLP